MQKNERDKTGNTTYERNRMLVNRNDERAWEGYYTQGDAGWKENSEFSTLPLVDQIIIWDRPTLFSKTRFNKRLTLPLSFRATKAQLSVYITYFPSILRCPYSFWLLFHLRLPFQMTQLAPLAQFNRQRQARVSTRLLLSLLASPWHSLDTKFLKYD